MTRLSGLDRLHEESEARGRRGKPMKIKMKARLGSALSRLGTSLCTPWLPVSLTCSPCPTRSSSPPAPRPQTQFSRSPRGSAPSTPTTRPPQSLKPRLRHSQSLNKHPNKASRHNETSLQQTMPLQVRPPPPPSAAPPTQ